MNIMYGGTKEEMERLVKDAAKIDKSFKYNTKTVIKNKKAVTELDMSYADIVRAIHIVQTNMGITGTTAEEAAKTISGSIGMLKAAWQNLITGVGKGDQKEIKALVKTAVDAAKTALKNVLPVAKRALDGILQLVKEAVPIFVKEVPSLVVETLPTFVDAATALVMGVFRAIPAIISKGFPTLIKSVISQIPKLATALVSAIRNDLIPAIATVLSGGRKTVANDNVRMLRKILYDVIEIGGKIGAAVMEFWTTLIQPILDDVLFFISNKLLPGVHKILTGIQPVIDGVIGVLSEWWQFLAGAWESTVYPILQDAWKFITGSLLPNIVYWLTDRIIPAVQTAFQFVVDLWNTTLQPVVMAIWETLVNVVFPKIIDGIQWVMDNLDTIVPIVGGVMAGIAAFMIGQKITSIIETVQKLFGVIAAHPFLLIVAAIGGVIGYLVHLYNTNEEARDKINAAWEAIKTAFQAAFDAIKGFWENTLQPVLQELWRFIWEEIRPTLIMVWEAYIVPAFETAFNNIKTFWEQTLKPAFEAIRDFVVKTLIPKFTEFGDYVSGKFLEAFKAIKDYWQSELEPRIKALRDALEKFFKEVIKPIAEHVADTFYKAWKKITDFFSGDGEKSVKGLSGVFDTLLNTWLKPIVRWLEGNFNTAWETAQGVLNGFLTFVTGTFSGNWKQAWEGLVGMLDSVFGGIKDMLKSPINAVIDLLNGMIRSVRNALNTVIGFINNALQITIPTVEANFDPWNGRPFGIWLNYDNPAFRWNPGINKINWSDNPIKKLAKGGWLDEGETAMVGEYAPEMLRVVNGRAIVTPLSDKPGRLGTNNNININVYPQPGQSPEQIAEQVQRVLQRELAQKEAAFV